MSHPSLSALRRAAQVAGASDGDSHWIIVSDLMASLTIVFLFLAILHMVQLERSQAITASVRSLAAEQREQIYQALANEFRDDLTRWNAELDQPTLTLRFREPEVLFDRNSAQLKPEFSAILRDFLPRYMRQLQPFRAVIREIRIEGHTSSEWQANSTALEAYFANMALSQQRTQAVLQFAYGLDDLRAVTWFRDRIAAVGLSSSRLVRDANGAENSTGSRRVEFAVLTNFEARLLANSE